MVDDLKRGRTQVCQLALRPLLDPNLGKQACRKRIRKHRASKPKRIRGGSRPCGRDARLAIKNPAPEGRVKFSPRLRMLQSENNTIRTQAFRCVKFWQKGNNINYVFLALSIISIRSLSTSAWNGIPLLKQPDTKTQGAMPTATRKSTNIVQLLIAPAPAAQAWRDGHVAENRAGQGAAGAAARARCTGTILRKRPVKSP